MGKCKKPLSAWKKKRRINAGLSQLNEERRRNAALLHNTECPSVPPVTLTGRRIVNICDFIDEIKDLGNHGPLGCSINNMVLIREKRVGLKSCFVFKCNFCNIEKNVWSENKKEGMMDINISAVSGTITTGGGHYQLEEMLTTMNIPSMSDKTFRKNEETIGKGLVETAVDEMKKAAEEEIRHALDIGDVDNDGTPLITVVADGSWCKRSYRSNYSSLSGVAAIVGQHTRKVLFMGVKNKYCTPCARAEKLGEEPKVHTCYKNWGVGQSASSMEPAIIADGFAHSEEMYGVKYARLIADGDSSVYKKILEIRPYKQTTIGKIECKNHLLRNFSNKLRSIATTSNKKKNTVVLRKKIGANVLRCRTAVTKATEHRKTENIPLPKKIENLRLDIINIPSHVFGEHKECKTRGYFCNSDRSTSSSQHNIVPDLICEGLYDQVMDVVRDLSRHSRSLITDVTSNSVEHYNSIISKYIGGKRINFAKRGSYEGRCTAAVVQYNTGDAHYFLHKKMYGASPGIFTKRTGTKRKRKIEKQRGKKRVKKSLFSQSSNRDQDYGPFAQRPDIDEEMMTKETDEFLENLKKTPDEISRIERETVLQSSSGEWLEIRRNLLTASNFGKVCKMKPTTGCESFVKQLLYSSFDCESMAYGRRNESVALREVERALGKKIEPCGLFIDTKKNFLGATPDGLIDDDGVLEIKCPSSAKNMTPEEAILAKKVTFWTAKDGVVGPINKNNDYFFQIQGQLHITNRSYAQFAVWTPKGIKIAKIERDDKFWDTIEPKLERFYLNCILPELIDPRHCRSMPIRNPYYIVEAQKALEAKRKKKATQTSTEKN